MTNPANGIHVINLIVYQIAEVLSKSGYPEPTIWRSSPITTVANNFDKLYIPLDSLSRSPKYTRYLNDGRVLRTHTTGIIPEILPYLSGEHLIMHPGICYRRDVVDKHHVGEPHQMDVWWVGKDIIYHTKELVKLIETILYSVLPGITYRLNQTCHPYTRNGLEIEVLVDGKWIEVGECGEAHPDLLKTGYAGYASGWGIDRLAMLVKGIDDIRLLRSTHPQIAAQMINLEPLRPVSNKPSICRDLSIVTGVDTEIEDICEEIVKVLGNEVDLLEAVDILSETHYHQLPPQAIQRLGMQRNQKNLLVRITLRSLHGSITNQYANTLREVIYQRIHRGN
ncbi:phenylalanyl-tRNA synthetase alpha chain [Calothrix sp. NIES-4101]|nr:phenylalanyl-tRNA synthetase alpha chain [Calothrix sp. NIES-4101]